MDQCISRSSVSPSPAASYSYSLSPTSNPGNLTSNATPIMSSLYLGQNQRHPQHQQQHQQQQQQQHHNINEQNLIQQQQQQQQQHQFNSYATLNDHLGNLDYSSINSNLLTGDLIDNSTQLSIDLESLLVNTTLSDSHILISGPPSCSDSTANNPSSENDLNQLSDGSLVNRNGQIISNLSNSSSNSSAHNDDFNNDDNVNNNINPMFLFKNVNIPNTAAHLAGVSIDYNNNSNAPNNTMNIVNINTKKKIRHMTDMTYNSSPSSSSSILHNRKYISNSLDSSSSSSSGSSNQTSGSGSDSLSSPKSNASSSSPIQFSSSMKKQQRIPTKIDEEELHANQTPSTTSRGSSSSIRNLLSNKINFQQQQQQQQQQHLAMSLPSGSYLMSKFSDQNANLQQNQPQIYNQSNLINRPSQQQHQQQQQQQQQVNDGLFFQQGSDPVLTQLVLNNTSSAVSNPSVGNANANYQQQPMLSALPNRLSQQKQQQQQQYLPNRKVNFFIQDSSANNNSNSNNQFAFNVANNSMFVDHNQSNQMISMSLPANYNSQYLSGGFVDRKSANSNNNNNERVQIKQEFIDDEGEYQTGHRSGSKSSLINSNFKNVVDDNDDKFARLKLSSPLSSANSQLYGGNGSSGHPSSSVSPNLEAINSSIFDVDNNGVNDNADIDVIAALAPSLDQSRPLQPHHVQASLSINDLLFNSKTPSPSPANTKDLLLSDMNDNEMGVNAIVNELKIAAGNSSSGLIDIGSLEEDYDDEDDLDDDLEEDDDEDDDDEDDLDDDDDEDLDDDDDDDSSSNKKPNIQGNSSYVFANTNNPQYMFSSAQPSKSARKQEKFYVGSVGSSLSYLNKRNHVPINSRKHARTNNSSGGVDVHTMNNSAQSHRQQQSQDVFSNFQFAPFNSSGGQQQQQQQQQQNQSISIQFQQPAQQHQQQNQFISTSLPPTSAMDSMMMIKLQQQPVNNAFNMNNQFGQQQQTVQVQMYQQMQPPPPQQNNHPNLNKLLLNNNNNNNTQKLPIPSLNNSQMYSGGSGADTSKRTRQASKVKKEKKSPSKEEQQLNNKKRHKKQQDLFDDDFEPDEDEDDDDEDEDFSDQSDDDAGKLKSSIKMEADDYESEDSGESNMTATNKAKKSGSRGGNSLGSASNSFANSDTLFDLMMSSKNRDSYFWQYNIQSKGPKTKKVLTLRNKDPHLHRDFFDPVFQLQSLSARGGTALNKLRKGDGNDVTPNADKLYNLGNQIRDFIQKSYQMNSAFFTPQQQQAITGALSSSSINQLGSTPTNSHGVLSTSLDNNMPPRERMNLKREKNKIASRACRLKKKAQHEANKIKLSGLNDEHSKLRFDRLSVLEFDLFYFFERMFFYDRF